MCRKHVGTAALGCPVEQSSTLSFDAGISEDRIKPGLRPGGQPRAAVPTWPLLGHAVATITPLSSPVPLAAAPRRSFAVAFCRASQRRTQSLRRSLPPVSDHRAEGGRKRPYWNGGYASRTQ